MLFHTNTMNKKYIIYFYSSHTGFFNVYVYIFIGKQNVFLNQND